ncbi:MAG: hypothetical protein LUD15_06130 [Bacteroides sp.]|nr:hypothetical protein [Bacteroides sp.]
MEFQNYGPVVFLPFRFTEEYVMRQTPDIYFRARKERDHQDLTHNFLMEMDERLRIGNLYPEEVESLQGSRTILLREVINEFRLYLSVILFLVINIFLGVTGTFWLNTHSRRHEIGLRIVMGSSRKQIRSLLLGEETLLLLITFIPALFVALHIQGAGLTESGLTPHTPARFLVVQGVTLLVLAGMVFAGIELPARRAMNTEPAEVLREE